MGIDVNISESVAKVFALPSLALSVISDEMGETTDLSLIDIQSGIEAELITVSFLQNISLVNPEIYVDAQTDIEIHPVETVEITKD